MLKDKFLQAYRMVSSQDGTLFIYAFSYGLIIAIAPFLIIAVLIASNLLIDVDAMVQFLSLYLPGELIVPFINYVYEFAPSDIVLIVSLASASFWVASRSIYSFLLETSRIDNIHVPKMVLRIVGVLYFVFFIVVIVVVVLLLRYLPPYNYLTIPLLMWVMMMGFYRLISFKMTRFSDVYMGAALTTTGLIGLGRLFFTYINDFTNYQNIYGPLSSLMIMLISVYFISYILYFGYCINEALYDGSDREGELEQTWIYRLSQVDFKKRK